jgi:hypothetical protein
LKSSQTTKPHASRTTLSRCLRLQQLRNLQLHVEKLGRTSINADSFTLVDFALAVFAWDAFLHAGLL